MSGHADAIRYYFSHSIQTQGQGLERVSISAPYAALDALLAERDEWKLAAGAEARLANEYHAENQRLREALERIVPLPTRETPIVSAPDIAREALAGDGECICGEINTRHCPVHGQGEALAGDTE